MDTHTPSTTDNEIEEKKLRRHFKFTNDDLEENRRGILSKKQIKRIAYYERGGKIIFSIIGVLLLIFPIGFSKMIISGIITTYQNEVLFESAVWAWGLFIAILVIFGLFLLAIGVAGVFLIISQLLKVKPYKLVSIRGHARLEKGHGNRFSHVYYDLHINNQQFDGNGTLNKVIVQGAEYIVYYLENNTEIMSIEKVSNGMSIVSE